jgi:hypothetical protein
LRTKKMSNLNELNLDEYFTSDIEEEIPVAVPEEYQPIQNKPHQTWQAQSLAVGGGAAAVVIVLSTASYFLSGGGSQAAKADKDKPIALQPSEVPSLKSDLWFAEQGNQDKQFMDAKAAADKAKADKAKAKGGTGRVSTVSGNRSSSGSSTSYSSSPTYSSLPTIAPPISHRATVPETQYSAGYSPAPYRPPAANQSKPASPVDANAEWNRLQTGSTYTVAGVDASPSAEVTSQQPVDVAYNQPDQQVSQNASWQQLGAPTTTLGRAIALKTEVNATLQLPVSSSGSQRTLLSLDEPLKSKGAVVLPAGTILVGSVQPDGSLMNITISSAYMGDQEITMPGDAISVLSSSKKFLVAKPFSGGGGLGRSIKNFALSAIGGVADQMLQPSSTTNFSNGSSTTTVNNVSRSLTNSVVGGVRGGVGSLIQDIQSQNSQTAQDTGSGLTQGTKVKLVFTAPATI